MADPTQAMVQRAAEYVPEGLRPDGWRERMGWYGDKIWQKPSKEREYDTQPFDHPSTWGADSFMEKMLFQLINGNLTVAAREQIEAEKKRKAEEERLRNQEALVGYTNVDTNRFGTQGEFAR